MCRSTFLGICIVYLVTGLMITKGCEDGWLLWDNTCYLFSITYLAWEDAKIYCENNGARLLKVDHKEEHEFIRRTVSEMHLHYAWIGAKYSRLRGKHLWIDGSEMTFNGWAPGEPGNGRGCVDYLHRFNYQWTTHCDCLHTRGRFICEKGCGEGWIIEDNTCLLLPEPGRSVTEMRTYCKENDGVLAKPTDVKDEGTFVCVKECGMGWEKFGRKCYRFSDQFRSWDSAESYCRDAQGSLVIVENQQEHEYIQRKISGSKYVFVWIGARYNPVYGQHRWVDGSPMNFTRWAPGLPGNNQGCVDYLHKFYYMWNSHSDCKNTRGPFICQKEPYTYELVIEEIIKGTEFENALFPNINTTPVPGRVTINLDEVFKGSNFCDDGETTTDSYISEVETTPFQIDRIKVQTEGGDLAPTIGGGPVPTVCRDPDSTIGKDPAPIINRDPDPTIGEDPVPTIIGDPDSTIREDPSPTISGSPDQTIGEDPVPTISGSPDPTIGEDPSPTISGSPDPTIGEDPVPTIIGDPDSTIGEDPSPSISGSTDPTIGEDPASTIDKDQVPTKAPKESDTGNLDISAIVESPSGTDTSYRVACFPNNTVEVYDLPENSYYLAVQESPPGTITKCTVASLDTTSIKITGCIKDAPIIFSHGTYQGIESYDIHHGNNVKITCVEISDSGVSHLVNGSYSAELQIDEQTTLSSSYTITSTLSTTSSQVGDPVTWTITFPVEYTIKVTSCTGKPDTSDIGASSVQLISNDGCTINTELISAFVSSPGSAVAVIKAFQFYSYDGIILSCDVIVCPSVGSAYCTTTCSNRKRDIRHRSRRLANASFPSYIENRLVVFDRTTAKGSIITPQTTMLLILVFALCLVQ